MQLRRLRLQRAHSQSGFTLVELTLAMAVFSVVLVIMAAGVLQLYRIYEAGHEIRDTQEAARTIAQDITSDTHDSLAVAVGTQNSQSSICLYKTIQEQSKTLVGVEYYLAPYNSSPGAYLTMHRATVSTSYTVGTPPGCSGSTTNDQVLTSNAVVIKLLQASTLQGRLIGLNMSVESAYAQQAGDFTYNAALNTDVCNPGSGSQYCSITNIHLEALSHSELDL